MVTLVAAVALGGFWLGTRAAGFAAEAAGIPATAGLPWVVVEKGDTLWSIADAVTAEGRDVDATVEEIMRLNRLDNSLIRPGTRLYVPGG
ncbi:LysM peptidoglycan-binding domain-containing protein [Thermoactinospora rubra]|uniref:LysM peptidoglycan-binding domain-containing protein n=1 Tax=Thermoactinospora rubra TaxID=1088767 RepID=UPI001301F9F4|nr:LysM peptidoglycan-binding domain-containing protein [Thermoactinospora rubra]